MDNKDKFADKFLKIQEVLDKGKEKTNPEKEIKVAQDKKLNLLLDMGILTYQKLREKTIEDPSFDELCEEIFELDKIIYENSSKIDKEDPRDISFTCECGNVYNQGDKFCVECGNKIEIEREDIDIIECIYCDTKIDSDSNFCICCGKQVNNY